jgi:hypothetical protein
MVALARRFALCCSVGFFVALAAPATASTVVYSPTPFDSYNVKGTVHAMVVVDDTVYVGGVFTQVKHNGTTYSYSNLAAFDVNTGVLRTEFAPNPNNEVRALATDGDSLYVGGKFTSISGAWRTRLAKIDLSGNVDTTFNASASARVDSLATDGSRVFAGGLFTSANDTARDHVASFAAADGTLDAWNPGASSNVLALTISPDATTIYAGGNFATIAGTSRNKLAALSTATGSVVGNDFQSANENVKSLDLDDDGSTLFAGDVGNDLEAFDVGDGSRRWRNTDPQGDVQAAHYSNGNVYIGFHDGADDLTSARVAAVDATSGHTEAWNPTFNSTYGVFTIAATANQLVVGGEFWQISGVAQDGIAIFPLA